MKDSAEPIECGFCEGEGCDWCWHLRAAGAGESNDESEQQG